LQKLVVWLWGIYTAGAAVGFALSGKELEFWPTFVIAIPSGLLILVYWGTVWVQMPKLVAFDPRSPTEIEQAYSDILLTKNRRLGLTLLLSVVTAVMVSVGLVVASVDESADSDAPSLQAALRRVNGESIASVTAHVGKAPRADLRFEPLPGSDGVRDSILMTVIPTEDGLIQTSTRLNAAADAVRVRLSWEAGDGVRMQASRTARAT
jgi:hypothetical protein